MYVHEVYAVKEELVRRSKSGFCRCLSIASGASLEESSCQGDLSTVVLIKSFYDSQLSY